MPDLRSSCRRYGLPVLPLFALLLTWPKPGVAAEPASITATFSIVAVDPQTGDCGAAVASKYPAVGKVVPYVRAGVGAFCTQHYHHPPWGSRALDLLAEGLAPETVLSRLLVDDPRRELRQLAIIDLTGRVANHNPSAAPKRSRYWGSQSGRYYSCQGNTLAGRRVISEMARAYEETRGSLADRLMAALVAGDCAGGDHRGRLAAGIKVARRGKPGTWFQLHVDKSDDAVADLLKKYVVSRHPAKGAWKGGRPPFADPCPKRKTPAAKTPVEQATPRR
ncbi:MAG: DUF1028 domain-containing protein [Planctomycetaceae bacterium]|jgi:uncharacterized Ntn-hydrolase superfamily protein|nr:DUF1028 domain-containing protein [Planctomycetaceae bacterium]